MEMRYRNYTLVSLLSWIVLTQAVWAAPSNTMSVTPACTSGTTILCSDETTRNNNISTPYNAHSHTDIAAMTGVNTFTIGDNTSGNKDYCEDGATDRCIRYNASADLWTVQQGGTSYNQIVVFSGTTGISTGQVLAADGTGALVALTSAAPSDDAALIGDSATAATWRTVPNCLDSGGNHLNYTQSTNSFSCGTTAPSTVASRVHRTAGDVSTTSTTLVDFTGASITLTTGAKPVLIGVAMGSEHTPSNQAERFNISVDGTLQFGTVGLSFQTANADVSENKSFVMQTASLTAASHTIKLQWSVNAGTSIAHCNATNACEFWVVEVTD